MKPTVSSTATRSKSTSASPRRRSSGSLLMADSHILSVRLLPALKAKLDEVASALDRPRNWVVNRALEDYAAAQAWQIGEIRRGLAAAEAGAFAEAREVEAAFACFRCRRRMGS